MACFQRDVVVSEGASLPLEYSLAQEVCPKMASSQVEDDENPPMSTARMFGLFKNPDPGFTQTAISIGVNFVLANMLVYGLSGRGKAAYLTAMATVPLSVVACVRDSQKDYEKWKEMRLLRIKGVPERFLPYKCKYDWSDYEARQKK
ncbi:unnamed protein product [Caenorhabditis auriculariae]|uniref:Uncharacterized protein n=1 Tax=Caenorhabditis auriculariae TaxID=2777116 RepID=A0A8S1HJI2_9PELO|nr:unnamed protein product [Caenorhabditis auriculariae]